MKNNTFLNFEIPIEIWSLLDLQKFGPWQIVKSDMFLSLYLRENLQIQRINTSKIWWRRPQVRSISQCFWPCLAKNSTAPTPKMSYETRSPVLMTIIQVFFSKALSKSNKNLGKLNEEYLRELLTTMGDRFNDEQVDDMFREAPIDSAGDFDYGEVHYYI